LKNYVYGEYLKKLVPTWTAVNAKISDNGDCKTLGEKAYKVENMACVQGL
jgi:hypothetical protein